MKVKVPLGLKLAISIPDRFIDAFYNLGILTINRMRKHIDKS